MKPNKTHTCFIEHKIINDKPFLELTLSDENGDVDRSTFRPTENQTLWKVILEWLYNYER